MAIYGAPSYQMGEDEAIVDADATAPVTRQQAAQGKLELRRMQSSLRGWLKYRLLNDRVVGGAKVKPFLRAPGAMSSAASELGRRLNLQRRVDEQGLADKLHQLLSEVFDPNSLPNPDVSRNPKAAVDLARIAIQGKLPGQAIAPQEQGMIWLWPLVIVVGAIAFVITTSIRSDADVAQEKERLECIKSGACTDTGFWLKAGAIAVIGWIAWDKLGVRNMVMKKGGR